MRTKDDDSKKEKIRNFETILPLSVGKIAALCSLDRTTIFRWIKRGKLIPWTTQGNHYRINPEDFIKFIQEFNTQIESPFPHKKGIKALFIDADEQMLMQYKNIIEKIWQDFTIVQAKSGFEGLIELGRQKPDFVILELDLPHFDGFAVIKHIKEDPKTKRIIIIVVSKILTNQNIYAVKRLGVQGYVKKPVNLLKFIQVVNKACKTDIKSANVVL